MRVPADLKRILPAGLVGPGRRPAWQRTRLRRVASAGLVATALWLAMSAFLPQPAPRGVPIVVVAQDLMAGHVLTQGDLSVADWPRDLSPYGAVADPVALVGKALSAGMARGEPVTAARVRGPGLLSGVRTGLVAAHVRLADPAMAAMATPGDHVDLISSGGKVVATDVAVLAVDAGSAGDRWSAAAESRATWRGGRGRGKGCCRAACHHRSIRDVRGHVQPGHASARHLNVARSDSPCQLLDRRGSHLLRGGHASQQSSPSVAPGVLSPRPLPRAKRSHCSPRSATPCGLAADKHAKGRRSPTKGSTPSRRLAEVQPRT